MKDCQYHWVGFIADGAKNENLDSLLAMTSCPSYREASRPLISTSDPPATSLSGICRTRGLRLRGDACEISILLDEKCLKEGWECLDICTCVLNKLSLRTQFRAVLSLCVRTGLGVECYARACVYFDYFHLRTFKNRFQ